MTSPLWSYDALVAAAQGVAECSPPAAITGFSIDTRSIQAGDVFVALTDSRDGHDFVTAAFKAGAAAALVRHDYQRRSGDGALLRVDNPLRALERIGIAARARLSPEARVIAVTGSAGKTGTKDMLRACLAPLGKTHAPEKSFNNHWGVPLTLARMPADTRYAVIEIGMNHAGEITPLSKMTRPHIAIITNVLPVHIGNFPDGEIGVANAKAEVFAGIVTKGTAILPRDSLHFEQLKLAAEAVQAEIYSFGADADSDVHLIRCDPTPDGSIVTFDCPGASIPPPPIAFSLGAPGVHLAINALAVVTAVMSAVEMEGDWAKFFRPLADMRAPAGRGARSTLTLAGVGEVLLIDESYNANPASMRAALANLALVPRATCPRRIAVLGDMRELGEHAASLHTGLRDAVIASGATLVFACGAHMQGLYDLLPTDIQGAWAATSAELAPSLAAALRSGDVVMIKGSLGTNMAPLVTAVRSLDAAARPAKA